MAKIKVLVVDDAVVIRKILTDALSEDPDIEVVGTASNGKIALQKIPQISPDIITLDIEMPEMNGLETLRHIRKDYPHLPVIMFSTLTEKGGVATLDALANGATDYVTKPANVGSTTNSKEAVRAELIAKIKNLAPIRFPNLKSATQSSKPSQPANALVSKVTGQTAITEKSHKDPKIVVIGVSTGGPNALADLLPGIPANFHLPIMIVQHMPKMFTKLLAERLNAKCNLNVVEAVDHQEIKAGTVYIAPGDFHLEISSTATGLFTKLQQEQQENSCRPAVDVLFRSAAAVFHERIIAVILTGMGYDGLRGCQLIKEMGGQVIAQDKDSSVVWGMPGAVSDAGLADSVLPLCEISTEIIRRASNKPSLKKAQKFNQVSN